jgi:hypothetical protein
MIKIALMRLMRRVKWLIVHQWNTLTLRQWPYESCKRCGKTFHLVWNVEDRYWREVMGVLDDSGGSLCLDCFIECAERRGINVPSKSISLKVFMPKEDEIDETQS